MMAKKKQKELSELSQEELLKKCENQRIELIRLKSLLETKTKENEVLRVGLSERSMTEKMRICINETLSLIDDVEELKKKLAEVSNGS